MIVILKIIIITTQSSLRNYIPLLVTSIIVKIIKFLLIIILKRLFLVKYLRKIIYLY
nr:MAG TPA: hypothetical protein [Bacteriophage sp.]